MQLRDEMEPNEPWTHLILIVELDGKKYLMDTSWSNNQIRCALELDENAEETTYKVNPLETYRITKLDGVYRLSKMLKPDEWQRCYTWYNPMRYSTVDDITLACYALIFTIEFSGVRDKYIITGTVTDKGRICFYSEPKRVPFYAYKRIFEDDQITFTEYNDYEEYRKEIKQLLDFNMPDFDQLNISN